MRHENRELHNFIHRRLRITQAEFAASIGVSEATVCKWLCCNASPSWRYMKKISEVYGMDMESVGDLFIANFRMQNAPAETAL